MIYRRLGRTNLSVSLLSLGTGGARRLGQAMGMTLLDQQRLVHHAMDLGVNLVDTAEQYGESESILGRCLRGIPRNQYFLSTKWAPRIGEEFVPNPVALQASVERSLQRLGEVGISAPASSPIAITGPFNLNNFSAHQG